MSSGLPYHNPYRTLHDKSQSFKKKVEQNAKIIGKGAGQARACFRDPAGHPLIRSGKREASHRGSIVWAGELGLDPVEGMMMDGRGSFPVL